jgi:hypothetical protein
MHFHWRKANNTNIKWINRKVALESDILRTEKRLRKDIQDIKTLRSFVLEKQKGCNRSLHTKNCHTIKTLLFWNILNLFCCSISCTLVLFLFFFCNKRHQAISWLGCLYCKQSLTINRGFKDKVSYSWISQPAKMVIT